LYCDVQLHIDIYIAPLTAYYKLNRGALQCISAPGKRRKKGVSKKEEEKEYRGEEEEGGDSKREGPIDAKGLVLRTACPQRSCHNRVTCQ